MIPAEHPSSHELERLHAGEWRAQPLVDHVASCEHCGELLRELEAERSELLTRTPPDVFVRELRRHNERDARGARARALAWAVAATLPLAVVATTSLSHRRAPIAAESEFVTKGAGGLEVIRERAGVQSRARERLGIGPGDALRLRFQLAQRQRVLAGIATDDGSWVPFFETELGPGTHSPEATLRVDASPSSGRVLLGTPEAVHAALHSGDTSGVHSVSLAWEPPP